MTDLGIANLSLGQAYIGAGCSEKTCRIVTAQPVKIWRVSKHNGVIAGRFAMAPPIHDTQNDRAGFLIFL